MTRGRVAAGGAVFAGYTGLALLWFRVAWADPANTLVGGCCDPAQYVWYLRWFGAGGGLFSDHVNAPEGINLMWQASSPLLGTLTAPVQAVFGPMVAYNLLITLAVSLSAFTCYLALRRWVGRYAGPVLGGLLFGFSPYLAVQASGHLNLAFVALVPLVLMAVEDVLVRQRRAWWADGAVLGVLVAAQILVAEEIVASLALMCVVLLLALCVAYPGRVRARVRHAAAGLGAAAVVAGAVCAYPLWFQFTGPQRLGGEAIRPPNVFVTDLASYVVPNRATALRWSDFCLRCGEESGYLGVPLLVVLVAVAVAGWSRPAVRVAALGGLGAAVLSLGPALHVGREEVFGGPLPGAVVDHVPVLKHLLPVRYPMYVYLAAAVLLAAGVRLVAWRSMRRYGWVGGGLVAVGLVATLAPVAPMEATRHHVPEFFRTAAVERIPPGATVLVLPFPGSAPGHIEPMVWQAEADMRFRMPGAYFLAPVDGVTTSGGRTTLLRRVAADLAAGRTVPVLTADTRAKLTADLRRYGVDAVLVGPHPRAAAFAAFATELVGRPPEEVGGVLLWTDV